jgi:uncharacterized heparinase superfamily protein
MLKKVFLFLNTIRYLKYIQISNRVKRKLFKPKFQIKVTPNVANFENSFQPFIIKQQKMLGTNVFKFLNQEFSINTAADWNSKTQEKLWLYNLHYFDDLNALNSTHRKNLHIGLIQKWIKENPPGSGIGWEPYPTSLRIINWIKWFLVNKIEQKEWLDSLAIQVRFLDQSLEYHLLGNHLFVNAKALVFAGLYFEGSEANAWYKLGMDIFNKELSEQVLSDGGNFELSPMYHAIFLEDLLDVINIHKAYDKELPKFPFSKALKMIDWINNMTHPDGGVSFFNDSVENIAPTLKDLLSYSERLNILYDKSKKNQLIHLKESGYIKVHKNDLVIIADVANIGSDYIPGHGHADALSFELSLFKKRVIVNSGISTYESGYDRILQRGTLSHSTITLDNTNSSEIWGAFRVARRAKVFDINYSQQGDAIRFSACHDGYKKLDGMIKHCRKWNISDRSVEIIDNILGNGKHTVTSVLPIHPAVIFNKIGNDYVDFQIDGNKVQINFEGKGFLEVKNANYHPEFGLSIANKQLIYNYNGSVPYKVIIKISW